MFNKEVVKEKVTFGNPFNEISVRPFILSSILVSLMMIVMQIPGKTDGVPSNIMLSIVKCSRTFTVMGQSFTLKFYYNKSCPAGWSQI